MSTTRKVMIGVGLASGALVAAWLLTGSRKSKTKAFVSKSAKNLNKTLQGRRKHRMVEETDVHYI